MNAFVCFPGMCWYTVSGMSLWQVVEAHRNTNVAGKADIDAEVNKSSFPGTFRKKGKKSQGSYFYGCAMTIIINVPFLVYALLVATLKKVTTPSHCTTGLGFCHTVLFKEQLRLFLASPKHSLDTKISSSNVLTRNILATIFV